MEVNQYLSIFIDESRDHLQLLNESLLNLENNLHDITIVQHIFRSAHTIKGMSATMGFDDMASLTHEMESVLDLIRNEKLEMNSFIFDILFKCFDALETMVKDIGSGGTGKSDNQHIIDMLQSLISGPYQAVVIPDNKQAQRISIQLNQFQHSILEQAIETDYNVYYVEVSIKEDCLLKAARAYMVFSILEENGEVVKSFPSVDDIEMEKFDIQFSLFYISKQNINILDKLIMNVSEVAAVLIIPLNKESLFQLVDESALSRDRLGFSRETSYPIGDISQQRTEHITEDNQHRSSPPNQMTNRTIRVDIARLDNLMNLFSEMLIDRVRLEQLASEIHNTELTETIEHITKISSDLHGIILKLRMVPVESVFNRFPRMIRDLSKSLDKKVELVITGADTELDRIVIDEIGDPLVHLLRNALDHGIEPIKERISANKPQVGIIHLRAFHSGNHVYIEIEEDGRGINCQKILQKALSNGTITQEEAKTMPENETYQILFTPGFSTADKVSELSGRGVGLDVVKSKITSLGGRINVQSKLGYGSKFSVQLPLTLSIITAMFIGVGMEKYAIPLTSIVETANIRRVSIKTVQGMKMIDYRNSMIPLISLSEWLECPGVNGAERDEQDIVVIRKGNKLAALSVDEFIGQQEIVLKSLGKYLTNLFAISGATIMGDGQVALIVDPHAFIK